MGAMPTAKPKLASTTYGRGSAAAQDARRKAKVKASADKLAALKARQEGDGRPA